MKPTFLYIKRHAITGKCYFGKTTKKDPEKYLGSGLHWRQHIKKHGLEHVETLWYKLFTDQTELTRIALLFSEQQDIIKSDLWLNMKAEDGLMGGSLPGSKRSEETRKRISQSKLGSKMHPITREAIAKSRKLRKNTDKQRESARQTCKNVLAKLNTGRVASVETRQKLSKSLAGREITWAHKTVATRKRNRELGIECTIWDVYSPSQEHFVTENLLEFAIEHTLPYNTLRQTNHRGVGKRGPCKGWIAKSRGIQFKKKTDLISLCQISQEHSQTLLTSDS